MNYGYMHILVFFLVSWMIKREQSRVFRDDFTWRKFKLKSISDIENDNDDDCDNDNNEKFLNFNYISGDMVIGENFSCDYHDMLGGLLCDEPGLYMYMYIYIYIYMHIATSLSIPSSLSSYRSWKDNYPLSTDPQKMWIYGRCP